MVLLVIEGVVIWFIAEWIENPVIGFVEGYPYWALVVAMHLTADFVVSYEYAVRGKVKWTGPGIIWLASFLLFGLAEYLTPLPK